MTLCESRPGFSYVKNQPGFASPAIIAIIENTCYSFVERLPSEKNEFLRDNS